MRPAPRHSVWTIVAPVALLGVFALAVLLVVQTLGEPAPAPAPIAAATPAAETAAIDPSAPVTYRIRKGDTLSTIAERYGVPEDVIRELNPGLDPLALIPGERIRLRPSAEGVAQ